MNQSIEEISEVLHDFDSKGEIAHISQFRSLHEILIDFAHHGKTDEFISTHLDWAEFLKNRDSLNWAEALEAASIALYG